jgi:peptidoglycan/xylan/chitin deacetylase (PgdA/CDA1 family)
VDQIHPILESHQFKALWFIPTNYLGSEQGFWFDQIQLAIEASTTDKITIGSRVWKLPKRGRRYTAYQIKTFMKSARPGLLDSMVEEVLDQTGRPPIEALKNHMLTNEAEIQALDGRGVHVASHSQSHRNLTVLDDDDLNDELVGSKQQLESVLNREVAHFAFPSGDHDERVLSGVRSAGYQWAWTTEARYINAADLPYQIPRVLIDDKASVATLAAKLSPLMHRIGLVK